MRHRVSKKKMDRDTDHRKSLLRNLSRSLILNGQIETTLAKAKFVRPYIEKLVTKSKKEKSLHQITQIKSKLGSEEAVRKLIDELSSRFENVQGGYTRIVKLGYRAGDRAKMARLEWAHKPKVVKPSTVKKNKNTKKGKVEESK